MAFMELHFHSEVLGMATAMDVILPQNALAQAEGPLKVLYLLHGLSDDHTMWQRRTSIERYADAAGIAVILPDGARSFYTDMVRGGKYFTHVSQEVPRMVSLFFPQLSQRREDSYIAGLSMGGYGALKIAMTFPERFAAAGSFSGAVDMACRMKTVQPFQKEEMEWIFGDLDKLSGSEHDLLHLADRLAQRKDLTLPIYQWCGTEDFLYEENLRFKDHLLGLGLPLTYLDSPGNHGWPYWDVQAERFIQWALAL